MLRNPGLPFFIVTENLRVNDCIEKIEKYCHHELWVAEAISLLKDYGKLLDTIDETKPPIEKGKLISHSFAIYQALIQMFLRCFISTKGQTALDRDEIFESSVMKELYDEIIQDRHDEYVHWKGHRSKIKSAFYISKLKDKLYLTGKVFCEYENSNGITDINVLEELFQHTLRKINEMRAKRIDKLKKLLNDEKIYSQVVFCTKEGEPLTKDELHQIVSKSCV